MTALLHERVAAAAARRPEATAVAFGDDALTYGRLDAASSRLARALRAAGCRDGDRAGLLLPKSLEAVTAMLACLKARCLYVPIDAQNPAPRAARIVEACRPRVLLAVAGALPLLDQLRALSPHAAAARIGLLDDAAHDAAAFTQADIDREPAEPPVLSGPPEERAHILFTSGSTGQPKGVVIRHANVAAFLDWAIPHFGIRAGDRVSGHAPFHFDLSTFDLFGALTAGAEVHLVPPELNLLPHKLAAFIRERRLDQWFSVPSVMNYMARMGAVRPGDFPSLKRVLWCGEVLPTPALIHWMERVPHAAYTNLYGPTEATIASSVHDVRAIPRDPAEPVPIGRACGGERLFVLDDRGRPVPPGEIGELHIAGAGLAEGYWEDPERTAAAFVPAADGDGRMYRTGDLARVDAVGVHHFLGRADSQVKSRGYRIELGEIEAALGAIPDMREYAVVAVDQGGFEGAAICCAFVTAEDRPLSPAEVRTLLSARLPAYMLPTRWAALEALPKNANGKIDRPRLRGEVFARDRREGA